MSKHFTTSRPPVKPTGPWLRITSELTNNIHRYILRDDLMIKVSPDAGYEDSAYEDGKLILGPDGKPLGNQNPGVTFPLMKTTEINGTYLPKEVDPSTVRIGWNPDHRRYPVLWGIVLHEGGHFDHTRWLPEARDMARKDEELAKGWGAAMLLEESRIELAHLKDRPQDTEWLAASATAIAVEEVAGAWPEGDKIAASRAAALILARVDAGILEVSNAVSEAREFAVNTFGLPVFRELEEIWREALNVEDTDAETMLRLGKRWADLTGDTGEEFGGGDSDSPLAQAINQALSDLAEDMASTASGRKALQKLREQQAKASRESLNEAGEQKKAGDTARATFGAKASADVLAGWRKPTPQEMQLARITRRRLAEAYMPERRLIRTPSELPPGRVSMRAAREAQGQRERNEPVTAKPYVSRTRQHVPVPPLKVGIINDVSSSQSGPSKAAASAAWSLAKAAAMIPDATVAMVTFGPSLDSIIAPGKKPSQVPVIHAGGGTQYFARSLQAVEGGLDLTRQDTARLLAILTDGEFGDRDDFNLRDPMLSRLISQGVRVLWLHTSSYEAYMPEKSAGAHTVVVSDWSLIPRMLCKEAVAALKEGR